MDVNYRELYHFFPGHALFTKLDRCWRSRHHRPAEPGCSRAVKNETTGEIVPPTPEAKPEADHDSYRLLGGIMDKGLDEHPSREQNPYQPRDFRETEDALRRVRRGLSDEQDPPAAVGVGLSGGGIRSATFCLGFFQAASRLHLLRSIDYLSTVSGGGYFGAFLGRLFTRPFVKGTRNVAAALNEAKSLPEPGDAKHSVLNWLRENGRYLSPRRSGGLLQMLAVILRNWVALHVTIASLVLFATFLLVLLRTPLESTVHRGSFVQYERWHDLAASQGVWISPFWTVAAGLFVFLAVPAGAAYWLLEWPSAERILWRAVTATKWLLQCFSLPVILAIAVSRLPAGDIEGFSIPGSPLDRSLVVFLLSAAIAVGLMRANSIREERESGERRSKPSPKAIPPLATVFVIVVLLTLLYRSDHVQVAIAGALWVIILLLLWADSRRPRGSNAIADQIFADAQARNVLTTHLRTCLAVSAVVFLVALTDSVGESVYRTSRFGGGNVSPAWWVSLFSLLVTLAAPAAKVLPMLFDPRKKGGHRLPLSPILTVVALLVAGFLFSTAFVLGHAVRWRFDKTPPIVGTSPGPEAWSTNVTAEPYPVRIVLGATKTLSKQDAGPPSSTSALPTPQTSLLVSSTAALLLFSLLFGGTWTFLNNSSQLPFYKARLARAYLGASNPRRVREPLDGDREQQTAARQEDLKGVADSAPGDDLELLAYFGFEVHRDRWAPIASTTPFTRGVPLHLINVTINETMGGRSEIEQRDRKGMGFCLGPAGLSAGVHDHVVFDRRPSAAERQTPRVPDAGPWIPVRYPTGRLAKTSPFLVESAGEDSWLDMEPLTLGHWTAISGAAFSTGTGYRTNLGLSVLAGIGNVRLGYWWDSHRPALWPGSWPQRILRRVFAVQTYLFHEFLGQFPGTSRRHWYLSDGGHFENLGGYELIRRRLPLIILVDAEADPGFEFGGLASLVRKVRIDFGANVHFLEKEDLLTTIPKDCRGTIGTLDQLKRGRWKPDDGPWPDEPTRRLTLGDPDPRRYSRSHAALAIICYPDSEDWSLLLYVKASMTGDEEIDLKQYHRENESFPHESTSDQFFDEAQWESYRKLGEHIAECLFVGPHRDWNPKAFVLPSGPAWRAILTRLRSEQCNSA